MSPSQPNPLAKLGRAGLAGEAALEAALAAGITYFEVGDGAAAWAKRPADRDRCFLAAGSPLRDGGQARRELEATLDRIDADWLDLWLVEDLRTMDDLEELLHPGGALDTLERLQAKGLVKALGVGVDADPAVLARAIAELPLAVVRLPVNPAEGALGAFPRVAADARARGLGLVGARALDGGRLVQAGLDPARLVAYALAQPVDVVRVGARTAAEVAALAAATPMAEAACRAFEAEVRPRAGQLVPYRGPWGPPC